MKSMSFGEGQMATKAKVKHKIMPTTYTHVLILDL